MADLAQMAHDECGFWRELVERGLHIQKGKNGDYHLFDDKNTEFFGANDKDLHKVMNWAAGYLEDDNSPKLLKMVDTVSFLLTAMFNKGFGPEFVDCAVINAINPREANAAAYGIAITHFKKHMPKHEPDDVRIRPLPPEELSKYNKLEKVTV